MKQHFRSKGLENKLRILDFEAFLRSEIGFTNMFEENIISTLLEVSEEVRELVTPSKEKYKTTPISLPREDIEQQFGRTMNEAAKNLNVCLSTLKRKCKFFGISEWQGPKYAKRKVNDSSNNQNQTNETDKSATRDSLPIDRGMQFDKDTLIIKAKYAYDMIKFHLPISLATVEAIHKEICDRFTLGRKTYKLKYKNEDEEWILMVYDQDLRDCIKSLRKLNGTAIRLLVIPLT